MVKRIYILEAISLLKRSARSENPDVAEAAQKILKDKELFDEYVNLRIERLKEKRQKFLSHATA